MELKKLEETKGEQEIFLASKEAEKEETVESVRRRTNEVHLESKARLDILKTNLDENAAILRELASKSSKLGNEVTEREKYYAMELEKLAQEETAKVERTVKPLLQDYKETQRKKMESELQSFKSPKSTKKIQFAPKGSNLETASPFDVVYDSQEKTNRQPRQITPSKMMAATETTEQLVQKAGKSVEAKKFFKSKTPQSSQEI